MKKIIVFNILFYFILNCSLQVYSQEISISGQVVDSLTNENVPYACIYIKNQKDSIVTMKYANERGVFVLSYPTKTEGNLYVSMMGYKEMKNNLTLYNKNQKIIFKLTPNVNVIDEVIVKSKANNVTKKIDRTVYTITEDKIKNANDIYDILKTLPGVVVDEQNKTIRFKGGQPDVLVDNMPANFLYPKLEMLKLDQIENIELIDRSSLYGGEGAGGIINVKMRRKEPYALSAYYSNETSYTIKDKQLNLEENFFNVNYFLSPFLLFNNFDSKIENEINTTNVNGTLLNNNILFDKKNELNSNIYKPVTYDNFGVFIPSQNVNFLLVYGYENAKKNKENITNEQILNTNYNYKLSEIKNDIKNSRANYFLSKLFFSTEKGHELSLSYTYAKYKNSTNIDANQKYNTFQNNINSDSSYNYSSEQIANSSIKYFDFYYNQPLNKTSRINVHASYSSQNYPENIYKYYISDIEYYPFYKASDTKFSKTVAGISYGKKIKRFKIDGTLNYEYSLIAANFTRKINQSDTIISVDLKTPFYSPSLRLSYSINKLNELNLGYSYTNKVGSPEDYLNYTDKQNPQLWQTGNSNLKPEFYNKIYSSYKLTKDSLNFSLELFYKKTNNGITYINYPVTPEVFLYRPENIAMNEQIGSDISFWYQISKRLNINFNSIISHSTYKADELKEIAQIYNITSEKIIRKQFGTVSTMEIQYKFNYKKAGNPGFGIWLNCYSKEISYTGFNYPFFDFDFAISKRFFKDKFFINFSIENILGNFIEKKSYEDYLGIKSNTINYLTENTMAFRVYLYYIFKDGDRGSKDIKY